MVRCPACGCESPDSAQWCDLCKEPFRRGRPAAAPAANPAPAGEPKTGIPPEFLALDTGGKIPAAPPWLRYAAWSVVAACVILIMAFLGAYLAKQSLPQPAQQSGQISQ
ncbi:MAG: hypothetical protein NTY77_03095 [Elusimicrobia bacterium]|nr:hypothetical protein [Elusimicrobiota bacterium]